MRIKRTRESGPCATPILTLWAELTNEDFTVVDGFFWYFLGGLSFMGLVKLFGPSGCF